MLLFDRKRWVNGEESVVFLISDCWRGCIHWRSFGPRILADSRPTKHGQLEKVPKHHDRKIKEGKKGADVYIQDSQKPKPKTQVDGRRRKKVREKRCFVDSSPGYAEEATAPRGSLHLAHERSPISGKRCHRRVLNMAKDG